MTEDKDGNATWEFNTATKPQINTGEMAWVTGATEPYKGNDVSFVNSPCFDLSAFTRPVISIKHWADTEPSDGAVLQYSVDGGDTWERLGDVASGLDWYNRLTISANPGDQPDLSSGWSLSTQEAWAVGKHTLDVLPPDRDQVRLRVAFSSFNNREQKDGFAFNNVVIEERNRTILVENFTHLQETANNDAFRTFKAPGGVFNINELVKLQYHHASAQSTADPDQLHEDNPTDQNARAAFYGVTNPVRAFVDGGFGQTSTNATFTAGTLATYFSLRSLVTSPVNITIDLDPGPQADKLNVRATVQATNTIDPGKYNVFIAIAEQDVLGQVYVLRKFLPNAAGIPLTSLQDTDPAQEIIVSYDMRHVTRLLSGAFVPFAVVVFVQHLETKDVLQTVMRNEGTASHQIVTGIETSFDNYIKVYPNPADAQLNIILPAPVKEETPVKLFDTFGKQVFFGMYKAGEHIKTLETKSFSAGVYLIQLSTPEGVVRKKAIVAHE
ncbi:MAG: T9SS type A sorting domain-containing protein [Cyclobacteriaceae bacterium]